MTSSPTSSTPEWTLRGWTVHMTDPRFGRRWQTKFATTHNCSKFLAESWWTSQGRSFVLDPSNPVHLWSKSNPPKIPLEMSSVQLAFGYPKKASDLLEREYLIFASPLLGSHGGLRSSNLVMWWSSKMSEGELGSFLWLGKEVELRRVEFGVNVRMAPTSSLEPSLLPFLLALVTRRLRLPWGSFPRLRKPLSSDPVTNYFLKENQF